MKCHASNALFLLTIAPFLSGCAARNGATRDAAARDGAQNLGMSAAVRGLAASVVTARAFDRAQTAVQRGDNAQLERAGAEMRLVAGTNPALASGLIRGWSNRAGLLYEQSQLYSGERSYQLQENSNAQYRAALAATPGDAAALLDAQTLNALGYFLADRGSTPDDYERAAVLTRAAFRKWDISGKTPGATVQDRALGAQDSYAWALFRLGRFKEARAQQIQVWKIARTLNPAQLSGDIAFHLGEIYRVLGEDKKARNAYVAALGSQLSPATRTLVEGGLKSLELARV